MTLLKSLSCLLPAERWLLIFAVHGAPGSAEALATLTDDDLRGLVAEPALRVARALAPHNALSAAVLTSALANGNCRLVDAAAAEPIPPGHALTPRDCASALRVRRLRARISEIQREIAGARGPAQDRLLIEKLRLVRQMRREPQEVAA